MAARTYPKAQGTCDLQLTYGCNAERDKTLRELGYTWQMARDWAPAFTQYWTTRGWDTNRFLDLYEIEAAHNDWLIATDTYMGIGVYIRNSFITQSRATIIWPDGWYRVRFGAMTGLGRYIGKHPNVYSDRTFANPGCTPGTCLEIDLAGWMGDLQPNRVCMPSTAWMADYAVAGGLAYTEGVYIEGFRFEGGMSGRNQDPSFQSGGVSMNEPGENSGVFRCMFANFNNDGLWIFNGTPGHIDLCSFFYNYGYGIGHTSSNALCNVGIDKPSGDNNRKGLIGTRARDAQSVAGGTFTIEMGDKSESRNVLQKLFVCEGRMGQLNLTINGATADYNNVVCPELITIEQGNSWEVNVRGLQFSSGVQSLLYHAESRKRLTGGVAFTGNSFVVNNEGLKFASRSNMALVDGSSPTGAPVIDSFTSSPSSLAVAGPVTLSWQTTNATSVKVNGVAQALVDGSGVFQVGANTTTFTLEATGPAGTTTGTVTVAVTTPAGGYFDRTGWNAITSMPVDGANAWIRTLDNSLSTFGMANRAMAVGDALVIDMQGTKSVKGIEVDGAPGWVNCWPAKFEVLTSVNGSTYTSRGTFNGAFNAAAAFTADCRYIKYVVKQGNPAGTNWLGISDFRVRK